MTNSAASELETDMKSVTKMAISCYHTTRELDCSQTLVKIEPYKSQSNTFFWLRWWQYHIELNMILIKSNKLKKFCCKFEHLRQITFQNVSQNQA